MTQSKREPQPRAPDPTEEASGLVVRDEPRTNTVPVFASLSKFGRVVSPRHHDDYVIEGDAGLRILCLGDPEDIQSEIAALRAVSGTAFPKVLGEGVEPSPHLVLSPVPSEYRALDGRGDTLSVDMALTFLHGLWEVFSSLEEAGYSWSPLPSDVWVGPRGEVFLGRLRCRPFARATGMRRVDIRTVLYELGAQLVPYPAVFAPTLMTHLLCPSQRTRGNRAVTVEELRGALERLDQLHGATLSAMNPCGLSDVGLRRERNEDAFAVARGTCRGVPWALLVVCDGVSSSARADEASGLSARVVANVLTHFAESGDIATESPSVAMTHAIQSAHIAVCVDYMMHMNEEPPGTTIVAALVYGSHVTLGWVGDSRAYFLGQKEALLLTQDHSWAVEMIARGELSEEEAMSAPLAHALTKCVGPLEAEYDFVGVPHLEPGVRTLALEEEGGLLLCSDGLWNYFPKAEELRTLLGDIAPDQSGERVARLFVNHALACGGDDNTTVAYFWHTLEPEA